MANSYPHDGIFNPHLTIIKDKLCCVSYGKLSAGVILPNVCAPASEVFFFRSQCSYQQANEENMYQLEYSYRKLIFSGKP